MEARETYEKWKQELESPSRTPGDAVMWCREQGLPADYVESLEAFISEMEAPTEGPH